MYRFEKANERAASEICLREFVFCANVNYIFSWNKQWNKPHYRLVFNMIKSSICVRKWLIYVYIVTYLGRTILSFSRHVYYITPIFIQFFL